MKFNSIVTLTLALLSMSTGCTKKESTPTEPAGETKKEEMKVETVKPGEVTINELVVGTGAEAKPGQMVSVHYTGWLTSGKEFDSSRNRGTPFQFKLGAGQVIPGWDKGVAGMKVGGKRKLTIPSDLAYGDQGAGNVIPPKSTLIFEVELLDVK